MAQSAAYLVDEVTPRVPVRQWVLSFPRRLRFLAAREPAFCSRLLDLFTRAVFAWQRRRGRLLGVADPRSGALFLLLTPDQLLARIAEAAVAKRILDHLGLASTGPPLAKAVAPEAVADPAGPEYGEADPIYED